MAEAYIVAAVRTAGGKRNGKLSGWHPVDLAASVLDQLIARTGCDPALVIIKASFSCWLSDMVAGVGCFCDFKLTPAF